jgi:hypothetical protein
MDTDSLVTFSVDLTQLEEWQLKKDATHPLNKKKLKQAPDLEDDGFFPHKLHEMFPKRNYRLSRDDEDRARKEGCLVRKGTWNKREKQQVKDNMERILSDPHIAGYYTNEDEKTMIQIILLGFFNNHKAHGLPKKVEDDTKYLHVYGLKRQDILHTQERRTQFLYDLGYKLPRRTISTIYFFARAHAKGLKWEKDITDQEREAIINERLSTLSEIKNIKIAYDFMVRPKTVYNLIADNITPDGQRASKEPFTIAEKKTLIKFVMDSVNVSEVSELRYSLTREYAVDWKKIAKKLKRTSHSCWQTFYSMSKFGFDYPDFQYLIDTDDHRIIKDDVKIIYFLQRQNEDKEKDIDWAALRSIMNMRLALILKSWDRLKEMVSKDVAAKGHRKTVEWLSKNILEEYIGEKEKRRLRLQRFYFKLS